MGTKYWTGGAGDGNFGTAGNWLTSTAPVDGDTVVFDRGNEDVTAGLTTGHTSSGLTLIGTSKYKGRIAPGANSLNAKWNSVRWGAGSINISGNITAGKFEPRPGSTVAYASGTAALLFIKHTIFSVEAAAIVTAARAMASQITDLYNGTGYTLMELAGGSKLNSARGGLIVVKSGCTAKVTGSGVLADGTEIRELGYINYLSDATIPGDIDIEPNGFLDARDNAHAFTFSAGELNLWPGARYDLNTRAGPVSPTLNHYSMSADANAGSAIPIS